MDSFRDNACQSAISPDKILFGPPKFRVFACDVRDTRDSNSAITTTDIDFSCAFAIEICHRDNVKIQFEISADVRDVIERDHYHESGITIPCICGQRKYSEVCGYFSSDLSNDNTDNPHDGPGEPIENVDIIAKYPHLLHATHGTAQIIEEFRGIFLQHLTSTLSADPAILREELCANDPDFSAMFDKFCTIGTKHPTIQIKYADIYAE